MIRSGSRRGRENKCIQLCIYFTYFRFCLQVVLLGIRDLCVCVCKFGSEMVLKVERPASEENSTLSCSSMVINRSTFSPIINYKHHLPLCFFHAFGLSHSLLVLATVPRMPQVSARSATRVTDFTYSFYLPPKVKGLSVCVLICL